MKKTQLFGMIGPFLACVGFLLWCIQYSGIYDVKSEAQPYLSKLPFVGYTIVEEKLSPAELQKRELERIQEAIADKEQTLANKELELSERERGLKRENELLEQRRRQIREIETKLAEQTRLEEDQDRRLSRLVDIYSAMAPDVASKQLEAQTEELAIEILKRMKTDAVAIILSMMTRDRAAALTLKMGRPEVVTQ